MTDCFHEMVMPPPGPETEKPLPLTDDVIQEQLDLEEQEQDSYEVEELEAPENLEAHENLEAPANLEAEEDVIP